VFRDSAAQEAISAPDSAGHRGRRISAADALPEEEWADSFRLFADEHTARQALTRLKENLACQTGSLVRQHLGVLRETRQTWFTEVVIMPMKEATIRDLANAIGPERFAEAIGVRPLIEAVGAEAIVREMGVELLLQHFKTTDPATREQNVEQLLLSLEQILPPETLRRLLAKLAQSSRPE
jgi:hypothetical protein